MQLHTEIHANGKTYRAVDQRVFTPLLQWPDHTSEDYHWTSGRFETQSAAEEAGLAEAKRRGLEYVGVHTSTVPMIMEL